MRHLSIPAVAGFSFSILMMGAAGAVAKPAYPGIINYVQPDGSEVAITMRGDHVAHAIYDESGRMLMLNDKGFLVEAPAEVAVTRQEAMEQTRLKRAENIRKSRAAIASALSDEDDNLTEISIENRLRDTYLFSGTPFPAEGEPHALVILVEFTDRQFSLHDPQYYFSRMLNQEGFSTYNMLGSVRDYFIENSKGKFQPVFDVYGPVELSNDMAYYGENVWPYGDDAHPEEVVIEACQLLDDEIDFSKYDLDGDGYIDNVYIYYAGYGEADSAVSTTIWPHSANISDFRLGTTYTFDGKILDRYGMSNEIDYLYKRTDGVGTFIHEFSHVLGLPDLYATTYTTAYTPGDWSVLDYGTYNNHGLVPPNYSFFERMSLGWVKPTTIPSTDNYELPEMTESNFAYIIHTENDDEFFILENRQQRGYDAYIPGHGMLVWHIDFNQQVWDDNVVNNSPSHQYVDIEEADNIFSDRTQSGDTFPGTANVTEISYTTRPSLASWGGQDPGVAICEITEDSEGVIRFGAVVDTGDSGVAAGEVSDDLTVVGNTIYYNGDTPAEVYNLAGIRVATLQPGDSLTPAKGIYIVKTASKTLKIGL